MFTTLFDQEPPGKEKKMGNKSRSPTIDVLDVYQPKVVYFHLLCYKIQQRDPSDISEKLTE